MERQLTQKQVLATSFRIVPRCSREYTTPKCIRACVLYIKIEWSTYRFCLSVCTARLRSVDSLLRSEGKLDVHCCVYELLHIYCCVYCSYITAFMWIFSDAEYAENCSQIEQYRKYTKSAVFFLRSRAVHNIHKKCGKNLHIFCMKAASILHRSQPNNGEYIQDMRFSLSEGSQAV